MPTVLPMKTAAFKFVGMTIVSVELLFSACTKRPTPFDQSPASNQLKHFVAEKKAQATAAAAAEGKEMLPEFTTIFAAAEKGDWRTISNVFQDLRSLAAKYPDKDGSTAPERSATDNIKAYVRNRISEYRGEEAKSKRLHGTQWQAVLEVRYAFDYLASDPVKDNYFAALGQDIIKSIPAGSIYFGGNDAGRWTVTALQASHVNGDPFFTLTQSALNDPSYLDYLRSMYGGKIYVPTMNDLEKCFSDYMKDAQRRIEHDMKFPKDPKQIIPGENITVDLQEQLQASSYWSVLSINELLAKVIFDHETNREFYVAESFPFDWMYPYLEPHGLIMKINHGPMAELSDEVVRKDHEFWTSQVSPIIGDWLSYESSVRDTCAFAEKVYLKRDFTGFKGDPRFVQGEWPQWMSRLRGSIAGIYKWRMGISSSGKPVPSEYLPKTDAERQRMAKEADFACRQSFALWPSSPEAVLRYIGFLMSQNRKADALLVAQTAARLDPKNNIFKEVLISLSKQAPPPGPVTGKRQRNERQGNRSDAIL